MKEWLINNQFYLLVFSMYILTFVGTAYATHKIKNNSGRKKRKFALKADTAAVIVLTVLSGIGLISLLLAYPNFTDSSEHECVKRTEYPIYQVLQEPKRFVVLYGDNKSVSIGKSDSPYGDGSVIKTSGTDNIVIKETNKYCIYWIWKIPILDERIYVHLSENLYNTMYSKFYNVIYQ